MKFFGYSVKVQCIFIRQLATWETILLFDTDLSFLIIFHNILYSVHVIGIDYEMFRPRSFFFR
jgi:hypothetical protein